MHTSMQHTPSYCEPFALAMIMRKSWKNLLTQRMNLGQLQMMQLQLDKILEQGWEKCGNSTVLCCNAEV
eukprot:9837153-Ditylum_brightwellii.AAC.1